MKPDVSGLFGVFGVPAPPPPLDLRFLEGVELPPPLAPFAAPSAAAFGGKNLVMGLLVALLALPLLLLPLPVLD